MFHDISFWQMLFSELLLTLPIHIFAYIPVWQHLRYSKKTTAVLLILIQLFYLFCCAVIYPLNLPENLFRLFAIPIYGIPFLYCVNIQKGKLVFLYIFTTDYIMLLRGISAFLGQLQRAENSGIYSVQLSILTLILFLLTSPAMLLYLKKTSRQLLDIDAPMVWNGLWLLPLFNSALVWVYTFPYTGSSFGILQLLARIVLMISMFLVYYYTLQLLTHFRDQVETKEQLRSLQQLNQLQNDNYLMMKSRIQETARARHDLRHHLRAIQNYITGNDLNSLKKYIEELGESLPPDTPLSWTHNPAVDAVLGFYTQKAYSLGIPLEISFHTSEKPVIPEHEFCVLLGNLLENAMEACNALPPEECEIRVNARQIGESMLVLTVDNTSPVAPAITDAGILSSKHSGLGIGTESVRLTASRYHGDARFEWKDGIFYASVTLNP